MLRLAGLVSLLSLVGPALAGELLLVSPVDCAVGEDKRCYIQHYVDRDPSEGRSDFLCGNTTYDGHKGTDFALRSHADMAHGVAVFSAAPGTVISTRDEMPDKLFDPETDTAALRGRDCGNGVVVRHWDGWETQYCHLRRGSVRVRPGDKVGAGQPLGLIGMSGRASFPHLHLSVRQNGETIDPFLPGGDKSSCGAAENQLWLTNFETQATGLISIGFSDALPDYDAIKAGTAHISQMTDNSPALVLWGYAFASEPGDILRLDITGPDGAPVYTKDVELTRSQAAYFRAGGRKTIGASWFVPGTYLGTVTLFRDGNVVSDQVTELQVTSQ